MLALCAVILLALLWATNALLAASRHPPYTFADWQQASERICHQIGRLNSPSSSNDKQACNTLLNDLLANTAFILNLVNDTCRHFTPETLCRARNVLSHGVALMLRLHYIRLRLRYWPSRTPASRQHCLASR